MVVAALALEAVHNVEGAPPEPDGARCPHAAGTRVEETLGLNAAARAAIPITHVIVLMQENRSFDHYFGRLHAQGQPDADGIPIGFANPNLDPHAPPVTPFHLPTTCVPKDPPHQWQAMHAQWNGGRMDGFVRSAARGEEPEHQKEEEGEDDDDDADGRYAMGYYDASDLPFYYWLASTYALGDRYFAAAMGGTWPNRQFMYTGTAVTPHSASGQLLGKRTIFDALDEARVPWRVYTDGPPRQDCVGWKPGARGVEGSAAFLAALSAGTLPPVSFLDASVEDEHPPADIQRGENWARLVYDVAVRSPLWPRLALIFTYDEGGGFFDHVPPPAACAPDAERRELDRRGTRVPLVIVSPWARPHHVSHVVHDHASVLRLIEVLHDLPALTRRDANADALLDMFDFSAPRLKAPPPPAQAGRHGCKPIEVSLE